MHYNNLAQVDKDKLRQNVEYLDQKKGVVPNDRVYGRSVREEAKPEYIEPVQIPQYPEPAQPEYVSAPVIPEICVEAAPEVEYIPEEISAEPYIHQDIEFEPYIHE